MKARQIPIQSEKRCLHPTIDEIRKKIYNEADTLLSQSRM